MTPGDPARGSCGLVGPAAGAVAGTTGEPADVPGSTAVAAAKLVGCTAALSLVGAGALGYVIGLAWLSLETPDLMLTEGFGTVPTAPGDPQVDTPPPDGVFGMIVHPRDFVPPDADSGTAVSWPVEDTIEINGRRYTTLVDRTNPDEALRQVWFPSTASHAGYEGRWGPRVTPDPTPATRRGGMTFPPLIEMFLRSLARQLSI